MLKFWLPAVLVLAACQDVNFTLNPPVPSPAEGNSFAGSIQITLKAHSGSPAGAKIWYTTDGRNPQDGTLYTGPFTLTVPGTVKAVARHSWFNDSPVMTAAYTDGAGYTVSTFAGTGAPGAADGPALSAEFNFPYDVAADGAGNVYTADIGSGLIRKISGGIVSTPAGQSFSSPYGVAADSAGNVYVADSGHNLISKITAAGAVSVLAGSGGQGSTNGAALSATFDNPRGVAVDGAGNVYVADTGNHLIRKISGGVVSTLAGSGGRGNTNGAAVSATFDNPNGVAVDNAGTIYVADTGNHLIRKINGGMVSTFAGTGAAGAADGPAAAAEFNYPYSLAADSAGNVYVADSNNNLIRRISGGMVAAFAGTGANRPFQDGPVASATFHFPRGVAVDSAGNIYAADAGNHLIRKIAPVYNTP